MRYLGFLGIVGTSLFLSGFARADIVTHWNDLAVDVGRRQALGPNPASRLVAIAHLAVYDAVESVTRDHVAYRSYIPTSGEVSLDAAVAQAAHDVLAILQPAQAPNLDNELAISLAAIPNGPAKNSGITLGALAASNLVVSRINDGSTRTVTIPDGTNPGQWRPTPRANESNAPLAAADPQWGDVTPFGIANDERFRPPAPPVVTSEAYATAVNEVQTIGQLVSSTRTAEQTTIARFWAQQTHIPFNAIARSLSQSHGFTIAQNARLFALLGIAVADSRFAVWDAKYEYRLWRPITAIRLADTDENEATTVNTTWASLLETPNHPEYVSGHSATGAAAAAVLAATFGNEVSFSVGSDTLAATVRSFTRLESADNSTDAPESNSAARENAFSRLYGGIHYRFSNEAGLTLGKAVGDYVVQNLLQAVPDAGSGGAGGEGGASAEGGAAGDDFGGAAGEAVGGEAGVAGESGASGEGGEPAASGGGGSSASGGSNVSGGSAGKAGGGGRGSAGRAGSGGREEGGEGGAESAGRGGSSGSGGKGGKGGATGSGGSSASDDDDGCSVSTAGHVRSNASVSLLLALGLFALGRRRRDRKVRSGG